MILRLATIEVVLLALDLFFQDREMIHIAIDDNSLAILHEETFVVEIILKSWMFNRSNMVRADVEENTNIKSKTVNPFHQISLTGNFHNEVGPIIRYCLSHHSKKIQTLWCCQG